MKMYYLNPNDYGDEYFVAAFNAEQALEFIKNSELFGTEKFRNSTINNLPYKYTLKPYEFGEVIRSEVS